MSTDALKGLAERVRQAAAAGTRLRIRGGETKAHLAGVADAAPLDMRAYAGIVDYQPSELVVTARAGTPFVELERLLAERGQGLPFEPPRFGDAQGR
ncbi:MAG TPA: FAD-binding protein, partial [Burkholderiaceae bacterium]